MQPARERMNDGRNMVSAATGGAVAGAPDDSAFSKCCKLTYRQRIYGCLYCFGAGFVISLLSMLLWWTGHTAGWAIMYTTGNIVSLMGSG